MDFEEILKKRKSVRAYDQRPVPHEIMDRVLTSVLHAPTAGFTQGNEFLVLDDPATVAEFWTITDDPRDPITPEEQLVMPPALILPLSNARPISHAILCRTRPDLGWIRRSAGPSRTGTSTRAWPRC